MEDSNQLRNIVVPTDFSEYANNAVRIAGIIAQKSGARLHLVHVLYSPANWVGIPLQEESMYKETKSLRGKVKAKLDEYRQFEELRDVKSIDSHIYVNEDTKDILTHAENLHADLIVLGVHGANKLGEILTGSTTRKIVRLAKCPVITAPEKWHGFDIKNIVITSDFTQRNLELFKPVMTLADVFNSNINLVWVDARPFGDEDEEIVVDEIKSIIKEKYQGIKQVDVLHDHQVEKTLLNYAGEVKADLLAVATHGRSGVARWVMGSLSEDLIYHSPVPVMATHL